MFTPDNFWRLAPTLRVFETNLSQMKGLYRIHIYEDPFNYYSFDFSTGKFT